MVIQRIDLLALVESDPAGVAVAVALCVFVVVEDEDDFQLELAQNKRREIGDEANWVAVQSIDLLEFVEIEQAGVELVVFVAAAVEKG